MTLRINGIVPHAPTHQNGGSDEVATATAAANAIPKADADSRLNPAWVWTRTTVTGAVGLSGKRVQAAITAAPAATYTITMPVAPTAGDTVEIVDEYGAAAYDTSAATYLVKIAGGTFFFPVPSASTTSLCFWNNRGSILLEYDGTSWVVLRNAGVYIDPTAVTGLKVWVDARKGITLVSGAVSTWTSLDAGNYALTQSTASKRPTYQAGALNGFSSPVFASAASQELTNASYSASSGAATAFALTTRDWYENVNGGWNQIFTAGAGATTGMSFSVRQRALAGAAWADNDAVLYTNGYNSTQVGQFVVPHLLPGGQITTLMAGRVDSTAALMWLNGQPARWYRKQTAGAAATIVAGGFSLCGAGFLEGYLHAGLLFDASVSDGNMALLTDAVLGSWKVR